MLLWQVICGIVLLISGIFLIIVVLLQEPKQQGAGGVITGGVSDTYYDKNKARTKEIKLQRLTKYMAIIFFILTLLVNLVPILFTADDTGNTDAPPAIESMIEGDTSADESTEESTESTEESVGAESVAE
jgi:protein translocase, SecG subunit